MLLRSYENQKIKPCVVFDIDHTVLHYRTVFGLVNGVGVGELRSTSPHVLQLYQLFRSNKIPIYFVTGRPFSKATKTATERELATLGLTDYQDLYFMPSILHDVGSYKESARDVLRRKHTILFNVGDQWTDMCNAPVDEAAYENTACLMYNVEPKTDWSLKLIAPKPHQFVAPTPRNKSGLGSIYDSVFDTVAPIEPDDVCQSCGHYKKYH